MRHLLDFTTPNPHRIVASLLIAVLFCMAYAVKPAPKKPDMSLRPKTFTRPKPTKPIVPVIPGTDRNQPDKFFLEHADLLYNNEEADTASGRQVVSGNVVFRKMGTYLYCDSAYYFPETASMDAFGNVRLLQGDTLEVKADYIYYDGLQQLARLRTAGRGKEVSLEHTSRGDGTKKYLYTDSLDYDLRNELAYFNYGGRMYNQNMRTGARDTLTSLTGQYSARTKVAEVTRDVFLRNSTSRLRTDRMLYHTDTRTVDLVEPTNIISGQDFISTRSGTYNMASGNAKLDSRSLIAHRDSVGNETTLEGDSIVYNKLLRQSEAYMFSNPMRNPRPMVITDTARRSILIGGYGYYNDSTKEAYAERYPLLKEFSRPDTIFLRADKVHIQTFHYGMKPGVVAVSDSLSAPADTEYHVAKAYNRARFFRSDLQGVADSITFVSRDSLMYLDRKPIVWSGNRMVAGSEIKVHFNDSTADCAYLPHNGLLVEEVGEGFFNQLRANHMTAYLANETLSRLEAHNNVQTILLPSEKDSTYNKLVNAIGDTLLVNMDNGRMDRLKLLARQGGEVTGKVTPLYIASKSQYYLPDFIALAGVSRFSEMERALEILARLRPSYAWYRNGWEDSLGELSFELEEYFTNPDMGIPSDIDTRAVTQQ